MRDGEYTTCTMCCFYDMLTLQDNLGLQVNLITNKFSLSVYFTNSNIPVLLIFDDVIGIFIISGLE